MGMSKQKEEIVSDINTLDHMLIVIYGSGWTNVEVALLHDCYLCHRNMRILGQSAISQRHYPYGAYLAERASLLSKGSSLR